MRVIGTIVLIIGLAMISAAAYHAVFGQPVGSPTPVAAADIPRATPETRARPGLDSLATLARTAFATDTNTATPTTAPGHPGYATTDTSPAYIPTPTADIAGVEAAWRSWMEETGVTRGAMAIVRPDRHMLARNHGLDPYAPVPVMSLSKAITGLCLDTLLVEQGLGWTTELGDIAARMSAAGITPRSWNAHITLGGLATHTAGLGPDLTQGTMLGRTHGGLGLHRRIATEALAEDALTGRPGAHVYANTNYAVLGVAIEALSGASYARTCMDRILRPAGITDAVIEGRNGSMSSFAGWEISAASYARLSHYWFTARQPHVADPSTRPLAGTYGPGYRIEGRGAGATISHTGRYCASDASREGTGAIFIALGTGAVFVATWEDCVQLTQYDSLQARIAPLLR